MRIDARNPRTKADRPSVVEPIGAIPTDPIAEMYAGHEEGLHTKRSKQPCKRAEVPEPVVAQSASSAARKWPQ